MKLEKAEMEPGLKGRNRRRDVENGGVETGGWNKLSIVPHICISQTDMGRLG